MISVTDSSNPIVVSICCITYNHETSISQAIEGFLMQKTCFPFEIIIHDDASTDRTPEIIREYQEKYPNLIKSILQPTNLKSKGFLITPIVFQQARGKFIALCEGDDYWSSEEKLSLQIRYMEENPKCTLTFHNAELRRNYPPFVRKPLIRESNNEIWLLKELILNSMPTCSMVLRREILEDLPGWFYTLGIGDVPLQFLCGLGEGRYAKYFPKIMSVYNRNSTGLSQNRLPICKTFLEFHGFMCGILNFDSNFLPIIDKRIDWHKSDLLSNYPKEIFRALQNRNFSDLLLLIEQFVVMKMDHHKIYYHAAKSYLNRSKISEATMFGLFAILKNWGNPYYRHFLQDIIKLADENGAKKQKLLAQIILQF